MPAGYGSLDQKPYDSDYVHAEVIIDHPVERVWPHALRIGSWMSAHRLETVAGEPGKIGHFERVFPRDLGPEVGLPHHSVYGIAHVIPLKYIALEAFPEKGGSYGETRQWMTFDSILLSEMAGRTRLIFLVIGVHMWKGSKEDLEQRQIKTEGARKLLSQYFENLKRLIDEED